MLGSDAAHTDAFESCAIVLLGLFRTGRLASVAWCFAVFLTLVRAAGSSRTGVWNLRAETIADLLGVEGIAQANRFVLPLGAECRHGARAKLVTRTVVTTRFVGDIFAIGIYGALFDVPAITIGLGAAF